MSYSPIPKDHVRVLYWVRGPHDTPDTASDVETAIAPKKGILERCRRAVVEGDEEWHNAGGHSLVIQWPSGFCRSVRLPD